MSKNTKSLKIRTLSSLKVKEENDSQNKTYLDSINNSKFIHADKGKENRNNNIQLNISSFKNDKNFNFTSNQKNKNFYKALNTINFDNGNNDNIKKSFMSLNTSKGSKNLVSRISEFPEAITDKSKDYNISKYLHHPITKQIVKLGNQIIKTHDTQSYKINNGLEINKPLISSYNMKNIFEQFNNSFIEIENSNTSNKINEKKINNSKNEINDKIENNNIEKILFNKSKNKNKKIKYFHKKNKSSITNYYFTDNNSARTIVNNNYNKNNRYIIHCRDNISSLIGGQNSNTTVSKDDLIKDYMPIHEVNDINININIFNNNQDLEVINDFDETKENKIFSTNKKDELENSSIKNEFIIKNEYSNSIPIDIFSINKKLKTHTGSIDNNNICINNGQVTIQNNSKEENNEKIKTFNKLNNYSVNKTLRKKYERTDFKFKDGGNNIFNSNLEEQNNYIMKNLINKFDQCSEIKDSKKRERSDKKNNEKIESCSSNKNNDTFVIKDVDNGLILNLDVSFNNDTFIKNNNIQSIEFESFPEKNIFNEISKNTIKNILNSIKSTTRDNQHRFNNKTIDINKINLISNNLSLNINDSSNYHKRNTYPLTLNEKNNNIYSSPESGKKGIKIHHFCLDSPFPKNDSSSFQKGVKFSSSYKKIKLSKSNNSYEINSDNEPPPQSVYDFTFYKKLLKAEEKMTKQCKIFSRYESILNTEMRLDILLWMMKTCEEFAFKRDTYHNSCYYFDKYLISNKQKINNKSELELIGLTCIVISAKLEEIQLPRLKEYAELLSKKYDAHAIIEMEKKICSKLSWRLIVITKNIWLSWYICQWDLFIDTIDNIKQELLNLLNEEDILYYKMPNDNSYYNFRKIAQLIDIMTLDFYSYYFEPRILIAATFFIILCHNYKFKYNFEKKKIENNTPLSNLLFKLYDKFITQSFDYNFYDEKIQKAIKYCYNYINFPFIFDLPLLYQVHQSKLEGDSYEDFLSYQTTNDNYYQTMKERININKFILNRKKKNYINNNRIGIINGKNIITHRKNFSSNINSKINYKK